MMLNKICIYNNRIFSALDTYLIAHSYRKNFKSQDEHFQECFKIHLKCTNVKDIRLEVTDNHVTGLKSLIILLFDYDGLSSAFMFCNAFRKMYRIALPNWSVAEDSDVFVSHGPTFLVHSNNSFHLHYVPFGVNNKFDCQLLFPDSKEYKILQFQCFRPCYNDISQRSLSLLVVCCNYSSEQSIKLIGLISEKGNHVIKCEQFNLHFFFPRCYESVLKAVQVTKCFPHFKANSLSVGNVDWVESMSVICTTNDCLFFKNAVLTYCCRLTLPLLNVMCMKTEFSNTFLDKRNVVLAFENKTLFFISITKNINCEVVKHWTDIEVAVTGDVLRKGSKQVLLIKQFDVDTWKKSCILYEILSFIPIDLLCHNMLPDICLKTTFTGLEKRIQVDTLRIKKIEHEISQKSAATIDALIKLSEFRVNREYVKCYNVFQESLVNLILSKDENKTEIIPLEYRPCIKLLQKKQKFIDNQWFINLLFINDGERNICNPSIKILMQNNEVACIQKIFINNSDDFSVCNEYSRQISPKMKFNIILCFEFSILHGEEEIVMILTWYDGSEDEFDNEIFTTEEKKVLVQHQVCLQIKISLVDVLNYNIKRDISSPDDLLFARTLRQRISLSLSSLHSDISRLENMLMKCNVDCMDLHLFESSSVECIAFNNEKSLLFGIQIFMESRENIVEIGAFIRNEKEICLLIHYLYQHLPEDVIIFPCLNFKHESLQLKKSMVVSMKNEIDLLISTFNIHNIPEKVKKNYPTLMSTQSVGAISIPKGTYERIRTVLVKKECITDTVFKCINTF